MYDKGTLIMYGNTGVCRVEDVTPMAGSRGAEKGRLYYKLLPIYGSGTIFVPVDTKIFMRPILTRTEAIALIRHIPSIRSDYETADNWHQISDLYQQSLHSHDCEELIHMIKAIYLKNRASAESGKRPCKIDQDFKKRAEDLLHGELAAALGVSPEEVPPLIERELHSL